MPTDYNSKEKRLFNILSTYLPKNKYIEFKNPFIEEQMGFNKVNVNYNPDEPIWFFKFQSSSENETFYCFGLNGEDDIKLVLRANEDSSNSSIKFFNSAMIGINIKFTKDKSKVFNFLNNFFILKSPPNDKNKYYIMLIYEKTLEIIPVISNLINYVDFDFISEKGNLLIHGFDYKKVNGYKLNNLAVSKYNFTEDSVNKVISQIEINNFNQSPSEDNLIEELTTFTNLPIFKSISSDFSDFEIFSLLSKIEDDIDSKKVSGDIIDIINFYFDEYKSIKRHYCLNCSLDNLKNDEAFKKFIFSHDYEDQVVLDIFEKLKEEIFNDNIVDEDTLSFKIRNYFRRVQIKNNFYNELEEYKERISVISIKYNLTNQEAISLFNSIENDIENDTILNDSIETHLVKKLEDLIELNQSKSRMKLNNVLKSDIVKEKISSDEMFDSINNEIGGLINSNIIRSNEITEKFVINKIENYGMN